MKNVIIIRDYNRDTDAIACDVLLKKSIMSHVPSAFFTFLFKEITLQIMVLFSAIFFIFLGLPIYLCLATIPCVAAMVFVLTYGAHAFKASEARLIQAKKCWVAEAHEPYFMNVEPKHVKYGVFIESEYKSEEVDTTSTCKKIVGMVSLRDCYGPNNSLWLYGLAVDEHYYRKGVAKILVRNAIEYAKRREFESLELVTTDLQSEARLVFQSEGFQLKQIYHRRVLGLATLGKYQMAILLTPRAP